MNLRSILVAFAVTVAVAQTTVSAQAGPQTTSPPPALTTAAPKTTPPPTTAAQTAKPSTAPTVTPAATVLASCRSVSVEGDATYCIQGPICSGRGDKPAGSNCPKIGDVAVADCLKYLKSYTDAGKCVAPVNAVCKVIKTGAWGCVWDLSTAPKPTPAPTTAVPTTKPTLAPTTVAPTTKPTPAPTTVAPTTKPTPAPTVANSTTTTTINIFTPNATTPSTTKAATALSVKSEAGPASSGSSTSTGFVAGAAAIGAAAAVAATVVYKRKQRSPKVAEPVHVDVVTP